MSSPQVRHILAPIDLGHVSEGAIRVARSLVSRLGADLTLIYVNDALTLQSYNEIHTGLRALPPEQEEMMEDAVRDWARPILGDFPYDVVIAADDPPRAIASAATRLQADLVVTGTHGRHGLDRMLSGSMSESILHATDRPVITVPHAADVSDVNEIVCAVDFSESGRQAAKAACCISRALGAQLHVVHVTGRTTSDLPRRLRNWIGPIVAPDCDFRETIVRGSGIAEKIVECATKIGADMLVLGARQTDSNRIRATIGTTAEKILRVSPIPVLSVVRPFEPLIRLAEERAVAAFSRV